MNNNIGALILAAGKGTRMYSASPKVLQKILGLPLLWYVYQSLEQVVADKVYTVVGFGREQVQKDFADKSFIVQEQQLGTGHALQVAWDSLQKENFDYVLVCNGDTPLVSSETMRTLIDQACQQQADMAFLSLELDEAGGSYGRVIRNAQGEVQAIVEAKDFDLDEYGQDIKEVNSGIYLFKTGSLKKILWQLDSANKQQEFYITQLIDLAFSQQMKVLAIKSEQQKELLGINNARELIESEEYLRQLIVEKWIDKGVRIRNRESVTISPLVELEPGVDICGPCQILGLSRIKAGAEVEFNCFIDDSDIGACQVHAFSHIQDAQLDAGCSVGPYARLRPGAVLQEGVKVGNFVEIKKSFMEQGSKASHLSYIGDSQIGSEVNIGAGTITCNYDGKNKHRTHIKSGAFIGSNTALVAPVIVGEKALVGAGSVVTKDVPEENLCIARGKQKNLPLRKTK